MWCDKLGNNFTSLQIAALLQRAVGSSYDLNTLEKAYRVGAIYRNGCIWFQRIS
jgi:hypothetical protein